VKEEASGLMIRKMFAILFERVEEDLAMVSSLTASPIVRRRDACRAVR